MPVFGHVATYSISIVGFYLASLVGFYFTLDISFIDRNIVGSTDKE